MTEAGDAPWQQIRMRMTHVPNNKVSELSNCLFELDLYISTVNRLGAYLETGVFK